jgi:LmbE family N-acetylglucosaminyl deacetylase
MLTEARTAVERRVIPVWRRSVLAHGLDITDEQTSRSCIVFAPHPDDETLGCGALIARKCAAGTSVRVFVASDGASPHVPTRPGIDLARTRADEVAEACRILGVARGDLVQLGLPDGEIADHRGELEQRIAEEIDEFRPDDVLVTSGLDWHPDHQAMQRAVRDAVRHTRWTPRVFEYPIWWWIEGPWRRRGSLDRAHYAAAFASDTVLAFARPQVALVASGPYLAVKRRAIAAHRSQVEPPDPERDWVGLDAHMLGTLTGRFEVLLPSRSAAGGRRRQTTVARRRDARVGSDKTSA